MTFGRSGNLPENSGNLPENKAVALWFITKRPGLTEAELALAMFGDAEQPRVNQDVRMLEAAGLIRFVEGDGARKLFLNVEK